jgi:prolyl-tRNA editing enzyme YbaK/EbsC (Cys-tRNA(Pro) deacylase)
MPTIQEVKEYLAARSVAVTEFEEPTPTCETAARAVGCSVGEIAKTVLFFVGPQPVVVVAAGDLRVRGSALKRALGLSGKVRLPAPHEVEGATGYAAGGVCPFLLPPGVAVVVDVSLRRFPVVHTAAGNDHSAVPVTSDQLLALTGGREADVCGEADA